MIHPSWLAIAMETHQVSRTAMSSRWFSMGLGKWGVFFLIGNSRSPWSEFLVILRSCWCLVFVWICLNSCKEGLNIDRFEFVPEIFFVLGICLESCHSAVVLRLQNDHLSFTIEVLIFLRGRKCRWRFQTKIEVYSFLRNIFQLNSICLKHVCIKHLPLANEKSHAHPRIAWISQIIVVNWSAISLSKCLEKFID